MKKIILTSCLSFFYIITSSQSIMCLTSGSGKNTSVISALTACGHYFGGSVADLSNNTDNYSCTSGSNWIGGESIFFFTDVVKGTYTFSISGFATDLDLFVLSACDEGTCLTNEGARKSSGRSESVTIDLNDGQDVYLVIDGKFVSTASFSLSVKCAGTICDELKSINCGSVVRDANSSYDKDATDIIDNHSFCTGSSYGQYEVVYELKTSASPITVDLHPLDKRDIDLFIYDDCTNGLSSCLGSSTISPRDESIYLASGGTGYDIYIAVDGKSNPVSYPTSGSYELAVTCGEPCDQKAIKIGCNSVTRSTTKGRANNASYYSCDGAHNKGHNWGPEAVYEFSIDDTYDIEIDLEIESNPDLNLYLLKSDCDPTSCIASSKSAHPGKSERIRKRLSKGKYYVVVEGFQGASGAFTLSLFGCGCSVEKELKCGDPINGTLIGKSNNFTAVRGDCFTKKVMLVNEDQTYYFNPPEAGDYSFYLHSFTNGMDLFLTKDCEDPEACIGKSTRPGNSPEFINVSLDKGEEVLVVVDGIVDYRDSKFVLEAICMSVDDDPDDHDPDDVPEEDNPDIEDDPDNSILSCGQSYVGSTIGQSSAFDRTDYKCFISSLDFKGGESIIALKKTSDDEILSVHMFHGSKVLENLSMFIMDSTFSEVDNCKGKNFRLDKSIRNGSSIGEYYSDADNPLPAGKYYAVLDGFNSRVESDFVLTSTCGEIDCESIVGLPCGESILAENTKEGFNGESIYRSSDQDFIGYTGTENIYSFCLDSTQEVDITMYGIHAIDEYSSDLDMFLMTNVCSTEKQVLASSRNEGLADENINIVLEAGEYYLVVDGWNGARAGFSLRVTDCFPSTCGKKLDGSKVVKTAFDTPDNRIKLYPNPFKNQITLDISNLSNNAFDITVFNEIGKKVGQKTFTKRERKNIDVSNLFPLHPGVFMMQIIDGKAVMLSRVIKM